jgi:hypothetical protein
MFRNQRTAQWIVVILISFVGANYACAYDITTDLVGHWEFDETSGSSARDSSGHNNHGTIYHAEHREGKIDGSLFFDGSTAYVYVPDSPSLHVGDSVTIAAWINIESLESDATILFKGYTQSPTQTTQHTGDVFYESDGRSTEAGYSTALFEWGTWYHLAFVFDAENHEMRLYVNGEKKTTSPYTRGILVPGFPIYIARTDVGVHFHGKLDDIRLYGRALQEDDIRALSGNTDEGVLLSQDEMTTTVTEPATVQEDIPTITLCRVESNNSLATTSVMVTRAHNYLDRGWQLEPCFIEEELVPKAAQPKLDDASCSYLEGFIKFGSINDPIEVKKLQHFLNTYEGESLQVTGFYDRPSYDATRRFQNKYFPDILEPWGHEDPTGYVYLTTRKKVNEIYCGRPFPLSQEEEKEVISFRAFISDLRAHTRSRADSYTKNDMRKRVLELQAQAAELLQRIAEKVEEVKSSN